MAIFLPSLTVRAGDDGEGASFEDALNFSNVIPVQRPIRIESSQNIADDVDCIATFDKGRGRRIDVHVASSLSGPDRLKYSFPFFNASAEVDRTVRNIN